MDDEVTTTLEACALGNPRLELDGGDRLALIQANSRMSRVCSSSDHLRCRFESTRVGVLVAERAGIRRQRRKAALRHTRRDLDTHLGDTQKETDPVLLATDGIHPTNLGHRLISDEIIKNISFE